MFRRHAIRPHRADTAQTSDRDPALLLRAAVIDQAAHDLLTEAARKAKAQGPVLAISTPERKPEVVPEPQADSPAQLATPGCGARHFGFAWDRRAAQGCWMSSVRRPHRTATMQKFAALDQHEGNVELDRSRDPVMIEDVGPVLHVEGAVAGKIAALSSRAYERDFADVGAAFGRCSADELIGFARRVDPGLTDAELAMTAPRSQINRPNHSLRRRELAVAIWPAQRRS